MYVFMRQPCKFLQLIPNLSGAINHIAISPQENYVAFTTQKGSIHIYVIDLTTVQPTILSSHYHEMIITQIKWKQNEKQLFLGDVKGNVFLVNLNIFLVSWMNLVWNEMKMIKATTNFRLSIFLDSGLPRFDHVNSSSSIFGIAHCAIMWIWTFALGLKLQ